MFNINNLRCSIATIEKERDLRVRKSQACTACHKMKKMRKFHLRGSLKTRLFVATVESILPKEYGSEP